MNLTAIISTVTKTASRGLLLAKKYSPEILTVTGILAGVGATVFACKATLQVKETTKKVKEDIENAHLDRSVTASDPDISDYRKNLLKTYIRGGFEYVRLYWPAVMLGGISVGCVLAGHHILKGRNVALAAAYAAVSEDFARYRDVVKMELGEEKERKLFEDAEIVNVAEKNANGDSDMIALPVNDHSIYCKIFDEFNSNYSRFSDDNFVFIKCVQNQANDRLHLKGHLFLNEVYDMLGFNHTKAGSVVGWVVDNGDNYVDFGVFKKDGSTNDFINGIEKSIILDFNVDGVIYDLIE